MKKIINKSNLLFLFILILGVLTSRKKDEYFFYYLSLIVLIELITIVYRLIKNKDKTNKTVDDLSFIIYILLFLWEITTVNFELFDKLLFPYPGQVISLFIKELPVLFKGLISSLELLLKGYLLALVLGILVALLLGINERMYRTISPITKILSPIPPIVYIPYAITILPTFKSASVFIIFIGAFWPIFVNTLNGIHNGEKKLYDTAKALNVSKFTMLFQVILPSSLPSIITGANVGMILSFILLTSAEMIGATSGLGWYVKYFSDYADYPRVIVGIIFIGIVVSIISVIIDKVSSYLLRWK